MVDIKCKACNKLLLKANVFIGAVKCSRCKMVFEFKVYDTALLYESEYHIMMKETTESNPHTGVAAK
jgi:phage FluMu protein Com